MFSWYADKDSFLHRASSLSKLAFVFTLWILAFVFQNPTWNFGLLLLVVGILVAARIPFSAFAVYLKIIVPVMAVFLILFPLLQHRGQVYFQYGWIQITSYGVSAGIIGSSRLGTLFFSTIGILLTTTKERALLGALMKVGVPFAVSFLLMLSMRFVSLSMGDLNTVREARRARAMPERENPIQLVRNMVSIVIPLFIVTIRRIQTSANALEVKGFSPGARRRSLTKEKITTSEVLWMFTCGSTIAVLAALRLGLGLFGL